MRLSHLVFASTLTLALVLPARTAPPGTTTLPATSAIKTPKAKKHRHMVRGVVIEVKHTKSHEGTFKIRVVKHHHKKGSTSAKAAATKKGHHIVTVHVKQQTKFQKAWHAGGKVHRQHAIFAELKKGEHVRVVENHHHHALDVVIHTRPPVTNITKAIKPTKKK